MSAHEAAIRAEMRAMPLTAEQAALAAAMDDLRAQYDVAAGKAADIVCFLTRAYKTREGPEEAAVALNALFDAIALDQLSLECCDCTPRTWQESLEYLGIFTAPLLQERKAKLKLGGSN